MRFLLTILLFSITFSIGNAFNPLIETDTSLYFNEENGLVVAEFESLDPAAGWTEKADRFGFTGTSFIEWSSSDQFSSPGNGLMEYIIKINSPGKYRFQWRCKVGDGSNTTEANDTWLKLPDASKFYAVKSSNNDTVRPKGVCTNDCPAGAGSQGWFKVYSSGTTSWTWTSRTSDNDAHNVFAEFDSPGFYKVQISGRSKHHLLDRFILHKTSVSSPTSLNKPETKVDNRDRKYFKLTVNVKDEDSNNNVAEASVYLNRQLKETDNGGSVFYYNVDTVRTHSITIRKDGYQELETDFKINGDTFVELGLLKINTDIGDISEKKIDVLIAPNPVIDQLNINSTNLISNITIVDITGKKVYQSASIFENEKTMINVSHLQNGIYFVRILFSEREEIVVRKIVKSGL